ncbi:hypothetical protein GYMLUDRAFT_943696 [Collybiopsis luxurians FD-317 M1]|uniref:Uncharacterized protein n=1 Tax=Collybiopsis luxurians FD-317 M1 TaxID=944289 RepID=A0A0D0CDQ2_9AGAR|nr:hypothetical protein GYMLUDRAFT_943696 [Collybiopsis luxurians FD-317 M1]
MTRLAYTHPYSTSVHPQPLQPHTPQLRLQLQPQPLSSSVQCPNLPSYSSITLLSPRLTSPLLFPPIPIADDQVIHHIFQTLRHNSPRVPPRNHSYPSTNATSFH